MNFSAFGFTRNERNPDPIPKISGRLPKVRNRRNDPQNTLFM
jgi:hypothetical protein